MNIVFFILIVAAFAAAGWREIALPAAPGSGALDQLGAALTSSASDAVTLGIGLIGAMALFQGLLKVAERSGAMAGLAHLLHPPLRRLFPDAAGDDAAMGAIVMNVAANMLGLSNAATPFGVRAMKELDRINPFKGVASDAMVLFLAINTANVTLLPTHVMAIRAAAGSHDPAAVIPTTLFATLFSTGAAILVARLGRHWFSTGGAAIPIPVLGIDRSAPRGTWMASALALFALAAIVAALLVWGRIVSPWLLPGLFVLILAIGLAKGVPIYAAFVTGAKEGMLISLRIIPYLVAILAAVGMLRASGLLDAVFGPLGRITGRFGIPAEALTMAALRTLSGSASFGYLASLLKDPAIGPDSYLGMLVSTLYGSSETTFYVLAVYFGAVGVKRIRHALIAGLAADLCGLIGSAVICGWLYK